MNNSSVRAGILLVDKPSGMTSHDVVSRVRKLAGTRRVGHAGTLDPLATGLLVLGLNGATRLLSYVVGLDKEYLATIRLGGSTPTDDAGSPIDIAADPAKLAELSEAEVLAAIEPLRGNIQQVPSAVSAIKVDGRRAYERVRAGESVELKARTVTVSAFDVLELRHGEFFDLDVRVECSTGTYIRALARDLGTALGVGGHLTALRRTRIGPFEVASAPALDDVVVERELQSPAQIARTLFRVIELDEQQSIDLGHGKRLTLAATDPQDDAGPFAAMAPDGRLIGLVAIAGGTASPLINFPRDGGE
jgi:tRNA pseudouridine55 synthase